MLDEYSEQVRDLSRRFFHLLLRGGRLSKAFRLAVDVNDYDLFMDLCHAAGGGGRGGCARDAQMAEAAAIKVGCMSLLFFSPVNLPDETFGVSK